MPRILNSTIDSTSQIWYNLRGGFNEYKKSNKKNDGGTHGGKTNSPEAHNAAGNTNQTQGQSQKQTWNKKGIPQARKRLRQLFAKRFLTNMKYNRDPSLVLLSRSIKKFKSLKCDLPCRTIKRICKGFAKLKIYPRYKSYRFSNKFGTIFSIETYVPRTNIHTTGKGTSYALAKASAFAELVERFSAGSYFDVYVHNNRGDNAEARLRNRAFYAGSLSRHNVKKNDTCLSPKELLKNKVTLSKKTYDRIDNHSYLETWVDAYDLTTGATVKVPIKLIEFISWSNGLAAGNTIEEATSQALCEIIERYTASQVVFNGLTTPTIDQESIDDPQIIRYINLFKSLNLSIVIKDFSLGKGYPSVAIIAKDQQAAQNQNPYIRRLSTRIKVGCAPDINQALHRCFTEIVQGYTVIEYKSSRFKPHEAFWKCCAQGDFNTFPLPFDDDSGMYFLSISEHFGDTTFLNCKQEKKRVKFEDLPSYRNNDACQDVIDLVSLLRRDGRKAYVINATHPVLDFPVVRIVIPGMSDVLDYLSPQCIAGPMGINNFLLGCNTNLIEYANDSSWLKSREKIKKVFHMLNNYFGAYGCRYLYPGMHNYGDWLFYTAYRLSLIIQEPDVSLRYLKTIRTILGKKCKNDATLSGEMLCYLDNLCTGYTPRRSLSAVRKQFGQRGFEKVQKIIRDHDPARNVIENPFDTSIIEKPSYLDFWIKSFFRN